MKELLEIEKALTSLLSYAEGRECYHEDTYRGGAIWTICRDCNKKWEDGKGSPVYVEPDAIANARKALRVLEKLNKDREVRAPPALPDPEEIWQTYIKQQVEKHMKPFYEAFGCPVKPHEN